MWGQQGGQKCSLQSFICEVGKYILKKIMKPEGGYYGLKLKLCNKKVKKKTTKKTKGRDVIVRPGKRLEKSISNESSELITVRPVRGNISETCII